jgi:hemolysin D
MSAAPTEIVPTQSKALTRIVPSQARAVVRTRQDREFLPAALEILETPAAPMRVAFLWVICLMFAGALAWSWFAKLDIFATATGRIEPSGRSKVVQPLEPGKVREVFVQNGMAVKAGDLLIELDPTETAADMTAQARDLEALDAEIARRNVAIVAASTGNMAATINFADAISATVRAREVAALKADLSQLDTSAASLRAELAEKQATIARLQLSIAARQKLVATLKERVEMKQALRVKEAGTRSSELDAIQALQTEETNLAYDQGQLAEAGANIVTLQRKIEQLAAQFGADQTAKLDDAERKRDHTQQDLIKASAKAERTRMTAPIDGTVQQLAVTTVGQVVTAGQSLMVIVPNQGPIDIEAMVLNRDIGFVEPGQQVIIKVESFPFTRYGTLEGKVIRVSHDAISEKDASVATDAVSIAAGQATAPVTGTQQTQNLVFPVTISLARPMMSIDGKDVPLTPGMTVSVEILKWRLKPRMKDRNHRLPGLCWDLPASTREAPRRRAGRGSPSSRFQCLD